MSSECEYFELVNDVKKRTKFFDETDPDYFPIVEDSGTPFYIEQEPVRARAKSKRKIHKIEIKGKPKEIVKQEKNTILDQINKKKRKKKVIQQEVTQ